MITLNQSSIILTQNGITSYTSLRRSVLIMIQFIPKTTMIKVLLNSQSRLIRKRVVYFLTRDRSYNQIIYPEGLSPWILYFLALIILP